MIKSADPRSTKIMETVFSKEKLSEKTKAPARIGIAAPSAALKGMINKARPLVKAI